MKASHDAIESQKVLEHQMMNQRERKDQVTLQAIACTVQDLVSWRGIAKVNDERQNWRIVIFNVAIQAIDRRLVRIECYCADAQACCQLAMPAAIAPYVEHRLRPD